MLEIDRHKFILARAQAAMTVRELSNAANVAASTITNIERGKSTPNPVTIGKLAKALNIDVIEIIEDYTI